MIEYAGPIQRVTPSATLWLALAAPATGALASAVLRGRHGERAAAGAMALATAVVIWHVQRLAALAEGERFLHEHLLRMTRVGLFDASLDLTLDPLAATFALLVTVTATLALVLARRERRASAAWVSLFVTATLAIVMADGFVGMMLGWGWASLTLAALVGARGTRAFMIARMADGALLLGMALLFWGFGGAWAIDGYTPDLSPRFAAVRVTSSAEADDDPKRGSRDLERTADDDVDDERAKDDDLTPSNGRALLTMTSHDGAIVFVDDARVPLTIGSRALRSPFTRFPVASGVHTFRIHAGGGLDDYLVERVPMNDGQEVALAPFGPSVTFRQLRDGLVAKTARGEARVRDAVTSRRGLGDLGLLAVACALIALGAAGKCASLPFALSPREAEGDARHVLSMVYVATCGAAVYMLVRIGFLLALSPGARGFIVVLGAAGALAFTARAVLESRRIPALANVALAEVGLMFVGVGVDAFEATVLHAITQALGLSLLFAWSERDRGGARGSALATLAVTGAPIPLAGSFFSAEGIAYAALTARGSGTPARVVLFATLVGVALALSFVCWRLHGATLSNVAARPESAARSSRVYAVLAVIAVAVGPLLGVSRRVFGDRGESLLERWLAPSLPLAESRDASDLGALAGLAVTTVWLGAALFGFALARRRARGRSVVAPSSALHALLFADQYATLLVRPTLRLASLVASLERWVIGASVSAVASMVLVLGWVIAKIDDGIVVAPSRIVADGVLAASRRAPFGGVATALARTLGWIYGALVATVLIALLYVVVASR
jgi:NADH:ubiquinone oxidoreductase subunit 5 (subunit L)/multisubunit Na+/H+ antiporter MnhA subunit